MVWKPAPRPTWVDALNALGANLGDDGRSLVPLDAADLLAAAQRNTGLDDYGDAGFRAGLTKLLDALESEARLTLTGRILARADLQRTLQNRLGMIAAGKAHPEISRERVEAPIFITGLGRTGTTLLHDLLSQDPANRVPMQWELMYSVPPPETATYASDPRIEQVRREITVMDEADPAFPGMHELAADVPTECIYIFAHEFMSDMWVGKFNIQSYAIWNGTTDRAPAYAWHRKTLQLLQWRHPGRWVLKAPSHLSQLPALFAEYPDARVVMTHRDPLRVLGSLGSLMATLQRMRSDHVDYQRRVAEMAFGFAFLLGRVMKERDAGRIPTDRITDIRYQDLVRNPVGTVRALYAGWGLPFTAEHERRIRARLDAQGHGSVRATHSYAFADTGLDLAEQRTAFRAYLERFGIPAEE